MFDTINFKLLQAEVGGVDILTATPYLLDNVGEHNYNGDIIITGNLGGLNVSINKYQIKIKDGSLCNGIWVTILRRWDEGIPNEQ